ncbi:MAG TPA: DinB family protein [Flavipsychrobacter sp.]|nr:DinB family protein [Flavipsychrobacter sp.]
MEQDLFVKMALQAWDQHIKRVNSFLDSVPDNHLSTEIAPGKNRVTYVLGHLTAVHDAMLPLLGLGERQYTHLDEAFINKPDKAVENLPSAEELKTFWNNANNTLTNKFNSLSAEEWFQKHTQVSEEDFAKEPHRNRLNVLINRTNHLAYHLGQVILAKK